MVDLMIRCAGRIMPVDSSSAGAREQYDLLKQRYRWIDRISGFLCLVGLAGGVFLPMAVRGRPVEFTGWDVGVQFGLGVFLPTIYILAAAGRKGKACLREFFRFYSLKYGLDARRLFLFFYAPVVCFGVVSACFAYAG